MNSLSSIASNAEMIMCSELQAASYRRTLLWIVCRSMAEFVWKA